MNHLLPVISDIEDDDYRYNDGSGGDHYDIDDDSD